MRVNVGCGPYPLAGYVNLDKNPRLHPDMVCDIRKGLPFGDNSVEEVWASHVIEHLDYDEFMDFLDEAYRVLKAGCACVMTVPLAERETIDHKMTLYMSSLDFLGTDEGRLYHNRNWRWDFHHDGVIGNHKGYDIMRVTIRAIK